MLRLFPPSLQMLPSPSEMLLSGCHTSMLQAVLSVMQWRVTSLLFYGLLVICGNGRKLGWTNANVESQHLWAH